MKKLITICWLLVILIAPLSSQNDVAFLSIVWDQDLGIGTNPIVALRMTHPDRVSLYKDPTDVFGYLGTFNWDGEEKKFAVNIAHITSGPKSSQELIHGTMFVTFLINGEQVMTEWFKPSHPNSAFVVPIITIPQTAPTEKVIVQVVIHDERPSGIYLNSIKFPLCPAWTVSTWDDEWGYYSRGNTAEIVHVHDTIDIGETVYVTDTLYEATEYIYVHDTIDLSRIDTIYKNVFFHDTTVVVRTDTLYETIYETVYEATEYIYVHDTIDRYKDVTIFEYGTDWRGLPASIQNVAYFVNPPVYYDLQGHKWLRYEDTPMGIPLIEISARGYVRFIRKQ